MKVVESKLKETKLGWIPYDWVFCTIQELVDSKVIQKPMDGNHGNIHPVSSDFVESGIPFIMANCIKHERLDFTECNCITKKQADKLQKGFSKNGDVLLTHKGSVGNTALVDEIVYPYIMLTPQVTYYRVIDKSKLNRKYLRFYFQSDAFQYYIKKMSGGGTRAYIGISAQRKLPFILPALKEQQKIAQILSKWDEAIETTQTLIEKLQVRKKGLMQELLYGKKRLAGFSEEWGIKRGDELFESISNKKHDGEFEVLSATQDKGVIPRSETGIDIKYDKKSLSNYKKLDIGDFVISLRSFQGGIEYSNYEGLVSPAYTVLREKLPISKKFYQEYMKTENFINRLNSIIYGIRDGKQISYKEFGSLKFEYPPLEEQKAISKIIGLADVEIEEKKVYLLKLKEQKKGLMQQLLTGKKRVKID